MKISKTQLRRIIKEEKARLLEVSSSAPPGSEERAIIDQLAGAASLFEAYADSYGSEEWEEEDDDSEEKYILDQIAGAISLLESYFDQFGPQAFG